ncbi:MAG: GAF domain-containing protein [Nitrospirae bacterium]|nr:GAF domain-containing protein [Nitrospirota bacterium]
MSNQRTQTPYIVAALFLGGALWADHTWFDGTRFAAFSPHPFWVIVLAVSARHGLAPGLIVAAAAGVAQLAGNLPPQALTQDRYQYMFAVTQLPLLWVLAAGILGGMRSAQLRDRATTQARAAQARRQLDVITTAYNDLKGTARMLEGQIAGQVRTTHTLCEAARTISRAVANVDEKGLLAGAAEVTRELVHPEKFSIFVMTRGRLRPVLMEGWQEDERWDREFNPDSELFRRVIAQHHYLCVGDPKDRPFLADQGVLAGPLIDPASGEAFGMLKVEQLAFMELGSQSVESFRINCEWIGVALADVRRRGREGAPGPFLAREAAPATLADGADTPRDGQAIGAAMHGGVLTPPAPWRATHRGGHDGD